MSCIGKLVTKNYTGYPIGFLNNCDYNIGKTVETYNDIQTAVDNFLDFNFKKCCDCECDQKTIVNDKKTTHFIIGESEKCGYLAIDVFKLNKFSNHCGDSAFLLSNKSFYSQKIVFFTSSNGCAKFNNIVLNNEGDHVIFNLNSGHGLFIGKDYVLYA